MRNFRFRLDPLRRLKRYQIERIEEEIAELERQIQQRLQDIEDGRKAVQEMRNRLLEEVSDEQLIQAERSIDLFRAYIFRVERQKQKEIAELRHRQEQKRLELIRLYQEEKILDRLRDRRYHEWEAEFRRQEGIIMDEIGTQKFIHKQREQGGVILYLLVPILLLGAVAAIGFMTGTIDKKILEKIPFFGHPVESATKTIEVQSATSTQEYYTIEQMLGDPNAPIPETLKNIADAREQLRQRDAELTERERLLTEREKAITQQETQLSGLVKLASDQILTLRNLEMQRTNREKSELTQNEEALAKALSGMKAKDAAPILLSLFKPAAAVDPKLSKENRLLVLRLLHRYQGKGLQELFSIMGKSESTTAADILKAYQETGMNELYGIQPTPTPAAAPAGGAGSATGTTSAEAPTLPPPVPVTIGTTPTAGK